MATPESARRYRPLPAFSQHMTAVTGTPSGSLVCLCLPPWRPSPPGAAPNEEFILLRFVIAIVLFLVAFVSIGYGIAQRTVLAGPSTFSSSVT